MQKTAVALFAFAVSLSITSAVAAQDLSPLEAAIVREQNFARQHPGSYAAILDSARAHYSGNRIRRPGEVDEITREGVAAVDEAIRYLRTLRPVGALEVKRGLVFAARDHVIDQGPRGLVGHEGTDSSMVWDRVRRYGTWTGSIAENIAYGPDYVGVSARIVVMQLIVDDGVADRGHRTALFDPAARFTGVACGPHLRFQKMCVLTYASNFTDN